MKEDNAALRIACDDKDALVAEANNAIEDCNNELHDVKAKLKHMVQVHYQGLSYSADLSSYKGDDSSLSVNVCLDQLQQLLAENRPAAQAPSLTKYQQVLSHLEEARKIIDKNNAELAKAKELYMSQKKKIAQLTQAASRNEKAKVNKNDKDDNDSSSSSNSELE